MSTTPNPAHQPFSASAPVSLTERRKAETRMEIARAAAALFVQRGLRATRAEDIAQAAGIAPRTFYRYFATKEEAVAPLYAAGAQRWTEAVRAAPAGLPLPQILEHAVRHTLTPGLGVSAASWEWLRTLIRLTDTSPALRKVWAEVCQASEAELADILATRTPGPPTREGTSPAPEEAPAAPDGTPPVPEGAPAGRDGSAMREGTSAGREDGSAGGEGTSSAPGAAPAGREGTSAAPGAAPVARKDGSAVREGASAGREGGSAARAPHAAPGPAPLTPELRFAAAVASAAVRVAVESWAATTTRPTGPEGPAALAVRNLRALRDFAWSGNRTTPADGS